MGGRGEGVCYTVCVDKGLPIVITCSKVLYSRQICSIFIMGVTTADCTNQKTKLGN